MAPAVLGLCLGAAPIIVLAFGVFFKPLSQEYHAGRSAISFAFTLQNLAAAAVLVIVLPIAVAFLRNDPRDKGLLPDGIVDADEKAQPVTGEHTCVEGLTWQQTWHSSLPGLFLPRSRP